MALASPRSEPLTQMSLLEEKEVAMGAGVVVAAGVAIKSRSTLTTCPAPTEPEGMRRTTARRQVLESQHPITVKLLTGIAGVGQQACTQPSTSAEALWLLTSQPKQH